MTVHKSRTNPKMTFVKMILILSIITLIIGLIGYYIFWSHWTRYIFVHIGAFGIIGLFACLAGLIAEKKGLNYKKAAILGFFPSILIGVIADYLVEPPRENGFPSSCGGVVSLGVAIIVVIIYLIAKGRK